MSDNSRSIDRRTALELLACGVASGVAGCFGGRNATPTPGSGQTGGTTGTPAATSTDTPAATSTDTPTATPVDPPALPDRMAWVFATGVLESPWPVSVARVRPATYTQYRDQTNDSTRQAFANWIRFTAFQTGVQWSDFDEVIATRDVYVGMGDFSEQAVNRHLVDSRGFEQQPPEYHGYLLYSHPEEPYAVGLGDGTVLATEHAGNSRTPVQVLREVIDTKRGVAERFHDEYPYAEPLVRWTGTHTYAHTTHYPRDNDKIHPGNLGNGLGLSFTDDGAEARFVTQFKDSVELTDELIQAHIDDTYTHLTEWTDRTRRQYGNIVVIDGRVRYESMFTSE